MRDDSSLALIASLNATGLVGVKTYKKLLYHLKDIRELSTISKTSLLKIEGIGEKTAEAIYREIKNQTGQRETELANKLNVKMITFEDENYPQALKNIFEPPLLLYVRGELPREEELGIGIVGSRRCTAYGEKIASNFAFELANLGIFIVSGLARGIDTFAHLAALKAKQGKTVAVLGSGLANIYPPENKNLAEKISRNGALISEYSINTPPKAQNFPRRNRIISGLSEGVIVIEAGIKSGALITAKWALEQGKDVFCVPGRIDSEYSKGTHLLIKEGAKLVENIYDVLEELPLLRPFLKRFPVKIVLSPLEEYVLEYISNKPVSMDELCRKMNLPESMLDTTIYNLLSKRLIESVDGGYVRAQFKRGRHDTEG